MPKHGCQGNRFTEPLFENSRRRAADPDLGEGKIANALTDSDYCIKSTSIRRTPNA
ncbi:MAG TPA: hypothetical protein VME86_00090 [Acidobacteriaceae bacterium]|nr:hypothetical protein [Acidobacteriaceae bacterium]